MAPPLLTSVLLVGLELVVQGCNNITCRFWEYVMRDKVTQEVCEHGRGDDSFS